MNFGIQAGLMNHVVDWTEIDFIQHPDDPAYDPDKTGRSSDTKFDANVGVCYLTPKYYIGLSALHLSNPKYDEITINGKDWFSQMCTQFFFVGGYHYDIDDNWCIRPEVFMRYVHTTPLSVNVGIHGFYTDRYGIGVNFMTGQKAISFSAKINLSDQFRIGYSYDVYYGTIKPYQKGTHEISVNYYLKDLWRNNNDEHLLWP